MSSVDRALAIVQLVSLRLGLRVRLARVSLDGLLRSLATVSVGRPAPRASLTELGRAIDWAERVVDRVPGVGTSCLYRSLGRFGLLRAWGFQPAFIMGIDRTNPELGHAWLELDGAPFRETRAHEFVVSFRFPVGPSPHC